MPSLPGTGSINTQTLLTAVSVVALVVNIALVIVTRRQLDETRRDRELAYFPYLVYSRAQDLPQPSGNPLPAYKITNIGRGPALKVEMLLYDPYLRAWRQTTPAVNLPQGGVEEAAAVVAERSEIDNMRDTQLSGLGNWAEWEKRNAEITVLVCLDQFGAMHRFLSTHASRHSPPERLGRGGSRRWKAWTE